MGTVVYIILSAILSLINLEFIRRFGYQKILDINTWENKYNRFLLVVRPLHKKILIPYLAFLPFTFQCFILIINDKSIFIQTNIDYIFLLLVAFPLTYEYIFSNLTNPLYTSRFRQGISILSIFLGWFAFVFVPEVGAFLLAAIVFSEMSKLNLFGLYSTSDKLLPLFFLISIGSVFQANLILTTAPFVEIKNINNTVSYAIFIAMVIAILFCYVGCGMKKVKISSKSFPSNLLDWALNDRLDMASILYWERGSTMLKWFGANEDANVKKIAPFLNKYGWILGIISLIIEFPILILFSMETALVTLASVTLLHLGIFFLSGILFWKWMFVSISFAGFLLIQPELFNLLSIYECLITTVLLLILIIVAYGPGTKARFLPCALGWWYGSAMLVERFIVRSAKNKYYLPRIKTKPFNYHFTFNRFCFRLFPDYAFQDHQEFSTKGYAKNLSQEEHESKFKDAVFDCNKAKQIKYIADLYVRRLLVKKSIFSSTFEKFEPPPHVWVYEPSDKSLLPDSLESFHLYYQISMYTVESNNNNYSLKRFKLFEMEL